MRKAQLSMKGRFQRPVPTSNLHLEDEADYREFEPFERDVGFFPRAPAGDDGSALQVMTIDMQKDQNAGSHNTVDYINTPLLVVRRGQEFAINITFNRPLAPEDDVQIEFLIGSDPTPQKRSLQIVTLGNREGGTWKGQILGVQGAVTTVGITPDTQSIVGLYRTYVAIATGTGMQRTQKDPSTNFYLLFNAWSPDDDAYYPDDAGRWEYVLNSSGHIYQGAVGSVSERYWVYGQFDKGVLDACIYIMDSCQMPIHDRGDIIQVSRKASAMMNSQDDNGVLVGNWSEDFSMGTPPTAWTGSTKILQDYFGQGTPVCFAQCWVYAGVLCSFMRSLGIPCRVITNFNSAHDNTGNLKTELIFKPDGTPDRRNTRDSIWNYHCWCEAFMKRSDLPPKYAGWQVVDATPQETSDGYFRCGPAPVIALKDGDLNHQFDCRFAFAEVNSDIVYIKMDRYGNMNVFNTDTTSVGSLILTKAVGTNGSEDITQNYKYPEGSRENSNTMSQAEQFGLERDNSEMPETKLSATITVDPCNLGDTVKLTVTFKNQNQVDKTIKAHLEVSAVFYTGVVLDEFKVEDFNIYTAAFQSNSAVFEILPQEYMPHLGSKMSLHFIVTGKTEDENVSDVKVIFLKPPPLIVQLSGHPQVNQQMFVTVYFKNPLNMSLYNARLVMEGAALLDHREFKYSVIGPNMEISQKVAFRPQKPGWRSIVAVLDCQNLTEVTGKVDVQIMP
ncbi:coagulation factor XIII A chain [Oryzias latipes]|uniref:protein-glutamine gamma-glutamyltransferase n=1 Tax=Oryzias latipes TaxID=8090 RepID=A0A3B3HKZ1_ORYLA|nr:coagulation factor XIII A chain [Oryzias latipes]